MEENKVIDVEPIEKEDNKPVLEKGNYIVEIISDGQTIKKFVAVNAEINIIKLADGGLTVELK